MQDRGDRAERQPETCRQHGPGIEQQHHAKRPGEGAYPGDEDHAILVRLAEDRFVAYDQQCTHLLCPVIAQPEAGRLHCPCHNGNFDLETGRVLSGPPERPLPRILLEVRGGVVYATGVEVRSA